MKHILKRPDIRTISINKILSEIEKARKKYPHAKLVIWASLECTNFSKAKGGKPREADSRTLALDLYRYYHACRRMLVCVSVVCMYAKLVEQTPPVFI
jgi:site-specific DNA-cytosine methylase